MNELWLFKSSQTILGKKSIYFNLFGDYSYLQEGYYKSVDFYIKGLVVHPTPEEALDAYIIAITLEKAKKANINVPDYFIATAKTPNNYYPLLGYSMNPFSNNSFMIEDEKSYIKHLKSLTLTDKYFAVFQKLPKEEYRLDTIRCILGKTTIPEYNSFAENIFKVFKIPLMKIKVIVTSDTYLLSSIEPLPYNALSINEKKLLEKMGKWERK
ncbi:MAG: RimK-like ATPgrasp N-terminal domain-containing protein [Brevinematia bacterium]